MNMTKTALLICNNTQTIKILLRAHEAFGDIKRNHMNASAIYGSVNILTFGISELILYVQFPKTNATKIFITEE